MSIFKGQWAFFIFSREIWIGLIQVWTWRFSHGKLWLEMTACSFGPHSQSSSLLMSAGTTWHRFRQLVVAVSISDVRKSPIEDCYSKNELWCKLWYSPHSKHQVRSFSWPHFWKSRSIPASDHPRISSVLFIWVLIFFSYPPPFLVPAHGPRLLASLLCSGGVITFKANPSWGESTYSWPVTGTLCNTL